MEFEEINLSLASRLTYKIATSHQSRIREGWTHLRQKVQEEPKLNPPLGAGLKKSYKSQRDSTAGGLFTLHITNPDMSSSITYGAPVPLGMIPENHWVCPLSLLLHKMYLHKNS